MDGSSSKSHSMECFEQLLHLGPTSSHYGQSQQFVLVYFDSPEIVEMLAIKLLRTMEHPTFIRLLLHCEQPLRLLGWLFLDTIETGSVHVLSNSMVELNGGHGRQTSIEIRLHRISF